MTEPAATPRGADAAGAADAVRTSGAVIDAFVALADTLVVGYDPADLLAHLVDRAVHLLGLTAAGLLLADAAGRLRLVASSTEAVESLELFQLQAEHGPCLECFRTGARVTVQGAAEVGRRWPRFGAAMDALGLVGVGAVPLRLRAQVLGALGTFSDRPGEPAPDQLRVVQGLADVATIALLQERAASDARTLTEQLQGALDSRVVIEQAKGVVAAQLGVPVADAFARLRTGARSRGTRLAELSSALVEGRLHAEEL